MQLSVLDDFPYNLCSTLLTVQCYNLDLPPTQPMGHSISSWKYTVACHEIVSKPVLLIGDLYSGLP